MRIEQVHFAPSVKFFESKFLQRWDISRYFDPLAPALFVGAYNIDDVNIINKHKGKKLMKVTSKRWDCLDELNPKDLVILRGNGMPFEMDASKYKIKAMNIQLKDFSKFVPTFLGDKIYCYLGNDATKKRYGYDLAIEIQRHIEHEIVFGKIDKSKPETLTDDYLKNTFYEKCFCNLELSTHGGRVSRVEMGYMGRKTIMLDSVENMVNAIKVESEKIGTMQAATIASDYFTNDWQDVDFWNEV